MLGKQGAILHPERAARRMADKLMSGSSSEVQPVSPIASLEALSAAIIALNRTPLGLEATVLLSEIDRLNRKGVHPDLEMLRRIVGTPKTQTWQRLFDIESARLVKTRHSRRTRRLAIGITPAGRKVLASVAQDLAQGGDQNDRGGAHTEQTPVRGGTSFTGGLVDLTGAGNTTGQEAAEEVDAHRVKRVRTRPRPDLRVADLSHMARRA